MSHVDMHSGSESEDDFNPEPEVDEDEHVHNNNDRKIQYQHDDDDQGPPSKRSPAAAGDADDLGHDDDDDEEDEEDDEDDEEDDDDEDDEEDEVQRPNKRRKRSRQNPLNRFIEDMAEVDDEDEEEEGDEDEVADEIHPDDLDDATGADLDDRRHRELDMKRQSDVQKDAEQLAKELDEKYRRREMATARRADAGTIPLTLPTVNDPSIWALRCKPGKEKEILYQIIKRMDERLNVGMELKVYSAFERAAAAMQGYIYVEADTKHDMLELVNGISNLYLGAEPITIELKERPDLLRKHKRDALEVGKFVRVTKPALYKGDLAKIVDVHSNGLDCTVQLVPRLDYGKEAQMASDGNKRKRAGGPRPPQKLFNETEAKKRHIKHLTQVGSGATKSFVYRNEEYSNGFLYKEVKINNIVTKNVNPKMEEMQLFGTIGEDGVETMDLLAVQAAQKAALSGEAYATGDHVEVYEGEQKGLRGSTVSVRGDIITIKVTEGDLKGRTMEVPVKTLRKLFREGDHVKVIGGSKYIDEVGMVTRIKGDKVSLLTDSTQKEITVFSRDLKRAADSATLGHDSQFQLYDMVQLDAATIGCVIKADREVLLVLDQNGTRRQVLHTQVTSWVESTRHAVATDRDGSEIRAGDTVKQPGGDGQQGKVVFIHRGTLFCRNPESIEYGGMFVVKSSNVTTMAVKSGRAQATGPDLSGMNPALALQPGPNANGMPPPRSFGRDKLISKTVGITKGPKKGLIGIVKETMGDMARVELHSRKEQVMIAKTSLVVKDPITFQNMDSATKFTNRGRGGGYGAGNGTPSYGGARTPAWGMGSKGPSWGAAAAGNRTPAWGGGKTPAWGEGSRTAYGGDGSRTAYGGATAYGDGNRTAYGGATAYGNSTAYGNNDGSRTAYGGFNNGGRTPAPSWGSKAGSSTSTAAATPSGYTAPTPGAYQAPTPGPYGAYSAPTPGAPPMDAPTPANFNAPTPGETTHPTPRGYGGYGGGYGAPTPAAAPTPGAWAEAPTPWSGNPETPAPLDEDASAYS